MTFPSVWNVNSVLNMMEESSLVIKVKYGDTLRRFSAQVDEDNQLDLDMVRLRAKIISLFNFTADANLMLKYVDEDGDLVTLVDDDDLHDVMRQRLKFLKIEVHMSNYSDGKSNATSSGSATPLRSPPVPNPFLNRNAATADGFKSLPEPIRKALADIKAAASSSPVLATLTDPVSRMGQSLLNFDSQSHIAADPSSKKGAPEEPVIPESRDSKSTYVGSTSNGSQQVEAGNVTRGVVARVAPVDLNVAPCDPNPSQSTNVNAAPLSSAVPAGDSGKGKTSTDDSVTGNGDTSGTYTSYAASSNSSTQTTAMSSSGFVDGLFSGTYNLDSVAPILGPHSVDPFKRSQSHIEAKGGMFHRGIQCDGCGVYPITGPRFKSKVKDKYDLCSICFNQMGHEADYIRMDRPVSVCAPRSFKGGYEHPPWMGSPTVPHKMFKTGPWMGPPTLPHMFKTGPRMGSPTLPPSFKTGGFLKHAWTKLDSRFILDVNVMDGTMMAPSTAFTKIWRMCNNGTFVWPKGTQLVWIGGYKFSNSHSIDLEVPEDGVPVDKELDIAVDFIAPELPGRYISYWRMASPSGQKFGQCVWVFIQVDASLKGSFYDSSRGLNLNIPLDVNGSKGPQIIDINVQPIMDDGFLQPHNPSAPTEPVKQMDNERPRQEMENKFAINEATVVGHGASPPATSVAPTFIDHGALPIIDFSETVPAVPSSQQSSAVDAHSSSLGIGENNSVEETRLKKLEEMGFRQFDLNKEILRMNEYNLEQSVDDLCGSVEETILKELEDMGFKQTDLNKEILRMNEYNLEQSLDDLCGVSEWDPILEELQQMGFRDNEMNKRLLMKNNGSIKLVVMDLINGEQV